MHFTTLISQTPTARPTADDRAVSPVIGVILMIAITVVLAAVVGSMALGLGNSIQQIAPNANFQFEYAATGGTYTVTATQRGGDHFTAQNSESLTLVAAGGPSVDFTFPVTAGSSAQITGVSSDTAIRVIWTSSDGQSSQTLANGRTP